MMSPANLGHSAGADSPVDYSRQFVPESFTPLSYATAYGDLTERQRLRYNQLHGCYCNEQIMFLERSVAHPVLNGLLTSDIAGSMAPELRTFLEEERRHTEMLRDLNRMCAPRLYERNAFYFVGLPREFEIFIVKIAGQPLLFPLFIWLMFLEEERAIFLGREILRLKDDLEPHFVATHRAHLADEIGHVEWDREILRWVWPRTAVALRKINARLLRWLIREFFTTPKRANLRVLDELIREFPQLASRREEARRQLRALRHDRAWNLSLHSERAIPKTRALLRAWPEFEGLADILPAFGGGGDEKHE